MEIVYNVFAVDIHSYHNIPHTKWDEEEKVFPQFANIHTHTHSLQNSIILSSSGQILCVCVTDEFLIRPETL